MRADDPMRPLIVRLPPELHQAVKDAARAADLSMAQWIRRAIREMMERDTPAKPDGNVSAYFARVRRESRG